MSVGNKSCESCGHPSAKENNYGILLCSACRMSLDTKDNETIVSVYPFDCPSKKKPVRKVIKL